MPFAIADATTITEAGYVGDDAENNVQKLLVNCDYDVSKAEKGVVFIDEIDKIAENLKVHQSPEMFQVKGFSRHC